MKTIKQLLTTIAVLLCSVMAHAYDFEVDGIRYDITSFTDLTVKASSISESITNELSIPSKVQFNGKELNVIEVSDEFAISNTTISSLIVNDGITYIGEKAFKNCTNLTTINIAQSVTKIGAECFYGCSALEKFNNYGIITFGTKTFAECNNLKEISIETLTNLGDGAFLNCTKLSICYLPNITSIEKEAFKNCQSLKEYNIPNSVISIGESAFENCYNLTNINISNNVKNIEDNAFSSCSNLTSMIIPNNITKLGHGIFNNCISLTYISIGAGLNYLPWIFEGCINLSDIRIEDATNPLTFGYTGEYYQYTSTDGYAKNYKPYPAMFLGFNLKNVYIGRNISTEKYIYSEYSSWGSDNGDAYYYVPNPPFSGSNIKSVTIGPLVSDLKMLDLTLYNSIDGPILENDEKWDGAFQNCTNLDTITILSNATKIPNKTFKNCIKITSLEIPNSVKEIGYNAFSNCKGLKQITLGCNLTTIGENAFDSCESLTKINFKTSIPPTYKTSFSSTEYINTKINVPTGSLTIYQETQPWKNFWNLSENDTLISIFEVDNIKYSIINKNHVEIIGHNISKPTDLHIKNKVEYNNNSYTVISISHTAFKDCSQLSSVEIENGIKSIYSYAFKNCSNLNKIIIPQSVNLIGEYALTGCNNLKELIFEDGETPLYIFYKGDYDTKSGRIKADNKYIYFCIEYYNSCFANLPIEKLYIGRNLSNKSRYSISEEKYDKYDKINYYNIISYDAPFSNLPKLKELIIGENVNILGTDEEYISEVNLYVTPGSFKKCSSIQTIEVKNPTPPTGAEFTSSAYSNAQLKVPVGSIEQYKNDSIWKNFINLMKFNITYAIDDSIYLTELITFGDTIILPETPTKEGYTFKGWSEIPETMPAEDITIIGSFAINTYAITYIVDGEIFATDSLSYSSEIILPEYPQKEGHSFSGWRLEDGRSVPKTMPAKNLTITGTFTTNSYWTTYYVDDKFYCDTRRTYGKNISLIDEPQKEGYTFSGWKIEGFDEIPETMPAQNLKIIGYFTINNYAVNYVIDGEKYATDSVVYDSEIILRDEPEKEGYTFSGWSKAPETMPANDITITGSFSINTYAITYMVDNEVFAIDSLKYGSEIVLRDEPTKEGYTFNGWSEVPETMPANDVTITGHFSINTYAITYMVDDEVFAIDSLTYGSKIVLRDEPEKEGYVFSGWSEAPETMPANDITITGSFDATAIPNVTIDATNIEINNNGITLHNINNNTITIYTINGVLVKSIDNYAGEEITLDKGLYIVCIGNESIKIKI